MKHDFNGANGWRFASPINDWVKFDPQAPPFSLEVTIDIITRIVMGMTYVHK
jgi:P2-related tail formation protein